MPNRREGRSLLERNVKSRTSGSKARGGASSSSRADACGRIGDGDECQLGEAVLLEPRAHDRSDVGLECSTCPYHGCTGRAERGQVVHRPLDVLVGHVAEDTAHEHDVGGNEARVRARRGGVAVDDLDVRRDPCRALASECGEVGIELDQSSEHVAAARMVLQDTEQVATVARAHADDANHTGRTAVQGGANQILNYGQALGQRRARRVALVPVNPLAHRARLQNDAPLG